MLHLERQFQMHKRKPFKKKSHKISFRSRSLIFYHTRTPTVLLETSDRTMLSNWRWLRIWQSNGPRRRFTVEIPEWNFTPQRRRQAFRYIRSIKSKWVSNEFDTNRVRIECEVCYVVMSDHFGQIARKWWSKMKTYTIVIAGISRAYNRSD